VVLIVHSGKDENVGNERSEGTLKADAAANKEPALVAANGKESDVSNQGAQRRKGQEDTRLLNEGKYFEVLARYAGGRWGNPPWGKEAGVRHH